VFTLDPPPATCTWYCGTGINVGTDGYVITSPPVLGGTFGASVTGYVAGNVGAFLAAFIAPLSFYSPWGEVLVDVTDPSGELLGTPSGMGNPAVIALPVPGDPWFAGFVFYTQAASFGGSLYLHCAYECTIGQ